MLMGDVDAMNEYMNRVALQTFSYFDTGERASGAEPEREKRKSLEETARSAFDRIRERRYSEELKNRGISEERINRYGFAFEGKRC